MRQCPTRERWRGGLERSLRVPVAGVLVDIETDVNSVRVGRSLDGYITALDIEPHGGCVSLGRITPATTAATDELDARARLEAHAVTLEHEFPLAVRTSLDIGTVRASRLPTVQTPRRTGITIDVE